MITTIFSRSNPFNYLSVIVLLVVSFLMSQSYQLTEFLTFLTNGLALLLLIASLVMSNVMVKRDDLTKGSTLPLLFFFSFLILFPSIFSNIRMISAVFFVLLGTRRLMSLQTLVNPKEKIFDASIWIFIASLFHFWSILFILLVFASVIFHVSRDYRNWILPYVALFATASLFALISFVFDVELIMNWPKHIAIDVSFDYFTANIQNIALSVYAAFAVLFFFAQLISFSAKPMILQSAYKKVILSFLIGIVIYVISPNKSNDLLIYTFMPSAVMATSYVEGIRINWFRELITFLLIGACVLCFFLQL